MAPTDDSPRTAAELLHERLVDLHLRAGEPSSRTIASGIIMQRRSHPARPVARDTPVPSHNTVARTLRTPHQVSLDYLLAVVSFLGGDVDQFRDMWVTARRTSTPRTQRHKTEKAPARPPVDIAQAMSPYLADDVFLAVHHRDGHAYLGQSTLELTLAGALLAELSAAEVFTFRYEHFTVRGASTPTDPRLDTVAHMIRNASAEWLEQPTWLWVKDMRRAALLHVTDRLARADRITVETVPPRLPFMRRQIRYRQTNNGDPRTPAEQLRRLINNPHDADAHTVMLAGLIDIAGGHACIPVPLKPHQIRSSIAPLLQQLQPPMRHILAAVDRAIVQTAIAR